MTYKERFVARLRELEAGLPPELYATLVEKSANDDWDFILEVVVGFTDHDGYNVDLDSLCSLIPGRKASN